MVHVNSWAKCRKLEWIFAILTLVLGACLRLWFPGDIEFKGDERAIFEVVRSALQGGLWPTLGMPSGVGLMNPGFSYWIFIILGKLFGAETPVDLARAVQLTNVAAMAGLLIFIFRAVNEEDREAWLWGAALVFLNPFDVLFHRKIWAQSLFPILAVLAIVFWWRRERAWGACLWGVTIGFLGQLQMGGGFPLALAYLVGTIVADWRDLKKARWAWFALGLALAAIPLWPWLVYVLSVLQQGMPPSYHDFFVQFSDKAHPLSHWMDHVPGQFFWLWITGCVGLGMDYSLFNGVWDFLETPFYLGWIFTVCAAVAGIGILVRFFWGVKAQQSLKSLFGFGGNSKTDALLSIGFFWFGLIFSLSPFFAHRHYLLVAFPFQGLWLASLALKPQSKKIGRALLSALCVSLFALSVLFLAYIHENGGAPAGDYGVAYSRQAQ